VSSFDFWPFVERLQKASDGFTISYETAQEFYKKQRTETLEAFTRELAKQLQWSFRWDIWAVGAIASGIPGIDFFLSYQIWLVLQGRDYFEAVLKDPARAADRLNPADPSSDFNFLFLETALRTTFSNRTGRPCEDFRANRETAPVGRPWSWKDLPTMHPDLWEKFFMNRDRRAYKTHRGRIDDCDLVSAAADPLRCWIDIYGDPAYLDLQYARLSPAQRAIHSVYWLMAESDNGGIDQFFWNSTGVLAPEALKGLRLLGARDHAQRLEAIMKCFSGGKPEREHSKRQKQIEWRWRSKEKTIDDEFPGGAMKHTLEEYLSRYIRAHPDEFFRPSKA